MTNIDPLFYIIVALILLGLLVFLQPILSNKKNRIKHKEVLGNKVKNALILYGTQSGNAQLVAQELQQHISNNGYAVNSKSMVNASVSNLDEIEYLFIVVSTYGEGEMPPEAEEFYKELQKNVLPKSKNLSYSVCALGDSSYEHFCWAGKQFDKILKSYGAKAFVSLQECDEDFTESAQAWINKSTEVFLKAIGAKASINKASVKLDGSSISVAKLLNKSVLANDSDENTIVHLSFSLEDNDFKYAAGDTIEVSPTNPKKLVADIVKQLNITNPKTIAQLKSKELTNVNGKTLDGFSKLSPNKKLKIMMGDQTEKATYLHKANVLDLVQDYKIKASPEKIVAILPSLKKRVYSIASSQLLNPNAFDLCIKTIRYPFNNNEHEGAGSVYMNESTQIGTKLNFTLKTNPHFKLFKSEVPIIMIATGTGIAPFRSFVQELAASESERETWLIWGQKYSANYAMYHKEFNSYLDTKNLNAFTPCFSKSDADYHYVQDAIKNQADKFMDLLNNKAVIYLCGSNAMVKGVKGTIEEIFSSNKQLSVAKLIKEKRWFEDVY